MIKESMNYFDLQSAKRSHVQIAGHEQENSLPVFPQYATGVAGVLASPILKNIQDNGLDAINQFKDIISLVSARPVLLALIIGFVLLPTIYKSSFDPTKPLSVQLSAIFTMAVGWQSLLSF
ncbi:MAG: hypothetical protein COA69_02535 [Robiginitomaculum sp.]|nr:MAG: hypothetical protein COA69_02535 [Robiginitomaculum sp.]